MRPTCWACRPTVSFDWLIGNERWKARVEEDEKNGTNTVAHTSGLDEVFNETTRSRLRLRP